MKREVEFTKKFANKKKGNKETYNSLLASSLVQRKLAKYVKPKS